MPQPIYDAAFLRTLSPALTNVAVSWMQSNQNKFIATTVFPPVPSEVQYGSYIEYKRGDWFRTDAGKRAPATETAGSGWSEFATTFAADVYGIHKDIDGMTLANARATNRPIEQSATRFVTNQMMIRQELDWAAKYFATGVWTSDQTGVASGPGANQFVKWDVAGSTPIEDIQKQILAVEQLTGFRPNVLVLGPQVKLILNQHAEIITRIQYSEPGFITDQILAQAFDVEKVITARAVQNTANEGATDAMSFVFGKAALLAYAAPDPSTEVPSAGYTFRWTGYVGAGSTGIRVRQFRIEQTDVTRVEAESGYDMKVVSADLGRFFTAAVS